ncbi:MAG: hypothetical protein Q7K25_09255 [Actinomycetota bacterium]|nr:hypothetical protein [Actinomycetota bacterium]
MDPIATGGTCQICTMNPKLTHTANEHELALQLKGPFLDYVKTDAFSGGDRPMTYAQVIKRFEIDTTVRRLGRVLDGMEQILASDGWPKTAEAGIAAYVVNATGQPGGDWAATWKMRPEDARRHARGYMRHLTLDMDADK